MKRTTITIFTVLIGLIGHGQTKRLIEKTTLQINPTTSNWDSIARVKYHYYNVEDSIIEENSNYNAATKSWDQAFTETLVYANTRLRSKTLKGWNPVSKEYVNVNRLTNAFGSISFNGDFVIFKSSTTSYQWNPNANAWDTTHYAKGNPSINGDIRTLTTQKMDNGVLVNEIQSRYTYSNKQVTRDEVYYWVNGDWTPHQAIINTYDPVTGKVASTQVNGYDVNSMKFDLTESRLELKYNSDHNLDSTVYKEWNVGHAEYDLRNMVSSHYNSNGQLIEEKVHAWHTLQKDWIPVARIVYTYGDFVSSKVVNALDAGVFPNPANDIVYIKADNMNQIKLVDMTGKTVKEINRIESQPQYTLPVHDLEAGTYMLIMTNDRGASAMQKLSVYH